MLPPKTILILGSGLQPVSMSCAATWGMLIWMAGAATCRHCDDRIGLLPRAMSGSMALQWSGSGIMSTLPVTIEGSADAQGLFNHVTMLVPRGHAATRAILIWVACDTTGAL